MGLIFLRVFQLDYCGFYFPITLKIKGIFSGSLFTITEQTFTFMQRYVPLINSHIPKFRRLKTMSELVNDL